MWRDSQNRVRTERQFCNFHGVDPGTYIEIRDPVSGYAYILDSATRTAHRYTLKVREFAAPPPKPTEVAAALGVAQISNVAGEAKSNSESLGTDVMESIPVQGTRTTRTIGAGEDHNDRPFEIVDESWVSPTLHIAIYRKSNDPRYGEWVTRLTNVQLGEPDPTLFEPPADYTVVDDNEPVKFSLQRGLASSAQPK